jgi:hypothetical protein
MKYSRIFGVISIVGTVVLGILGVVHNNAGIMIGGVLWMFVCCELMLITMAKE